MEPSEVQMVEMDRNETLELNDSSPPADLGGPLPGLKASDPQVSVVVRGRTVAVEIQKFIGVMDVLKRVGIARVGVMTGGGGAK